MIFIQLQEQLEQLGNVLSQIDDEQFCRPVKHLGGATIGQHARHIIELLQCALSGNISGTVDYLNRVRDLSLEIDRKKAMDVISELREMNRSADKPLLLVSGTDDCQVTTSFHREVVYNTEHTTHHLALIKVALIEMDLHVYDEHFGYSGSTLLYKASMPQHS